MRSSRLPYCGCRRGRRTFVSDLYRHQRLTARRHHPPYGSSRLDRQACRLTGASAPFSHIPPPPCHTRMVLRHESTMSDQRLEGTEAGITPPTVVSIATEMVGRHSVRISRSSAYWIDSCTLRTPHRPTSTQQTELKVSITIASTASAC